MRAVPRRTALAVFGLVFFAPALLSQQPPLTILSNTTRRTLATTMVNEQEYVGLDELAAMFQLAVREEPGGMLAVTYKGKTILLTQDQPLGSVGGRIVALPAPTIRNNRRWLTNQAMFTDVNLYLSNRALEAIDPPSALPEPKAL